MADPQLSDAELAARYGFAMAVLNSNAELKALFQRAVSQTYTPERFQAELRATQWFQKNGEQWRNASIQKASDPATYNASVTQVRVRLGMMASEVGARLTGAQLEQMAESAYMFGWDDNQIRQSLSTYIQYTNGRMMGQAGQWETELRQYVQSMGMTLSDAAIQAYVQRAVAGKSTIEDGKSWVREMAISANPHLADRLRAGETVADIADPYRQTMAQLLEVNPESITVYDATIKGALQAKDADGKPVLRTLYDFENDLRKDPRWLKTKNAQQSAMNTVSRVLKDFGVVS